MENSRQLAETLYARPGVSQMETQICKTIGGNYVYRHIIASNSKCASRVYNPVTGEDRFLDNQNMVHHLIKNLNLSYATSAEALIGAEVQNYYESQIKP